MDLQRAGVIGDPYYRKNEAAYRWIANTSWTFDTNFTLSPGLTGGHGQAGQHVELVMEGVDTVGSVHLNGQLLAPVHNMFRRWVFDVSHVVSSHQSNHLQVLLRSPVLEAERLSSLYPYPLPRADPVTVHPMGERQFIRKSQVDWGWNNQPVNAEHLRQRDDRSL
jgi:beta-mannosidase